jgi:hypothetical protein
MPSLMGTGEMNKAVKIASAAKTSEIDESILNI